MQLRCLLVDDSPAFIRLASARLEADGISVVGAAASGEEALERARELRPDVALVDIELVESSGFALVSRLVEAAGADVILMSADAEDEFAALIDASPAIGFVTKTDLGAAAIARLIAHRRGQDRA